MASSDQGLLRRQELSSCNPINHVASGSGGRKIGIVIDASYSMETNDPTNQRLTVAKDLAAALISQHVSAGEQSLDLLSVVAFGATADVVYGLGDPAGAVSLFDTITPMSGTFIGSGIMATIDDLESSNNLTAGRTGLVIFSDGVDNSPAYTTRTIASLRRARDLDIRVSFGYIYPDAFDLGDVQTQQALIEVQSRPWMDWTGLTL